MRHTVVGPHRDDMRLSVHGAGRAASRFASEGQQRSIALALRLGEGALITQAWRRPPLYLVDDVFGELDRMRRNTLMEALDSVPQQLVTTTSMDWRDGPDPAAETGERLGEFVAVGIVRQAASPDEN